jgi:pimeloyl-ACP methyl ester carboxylesterase
MTAGLREWFLDLGSKTRKELIVQSGKLHPNWREREVELWAEGKLLVRRNVIQEFEQAAPQWRDTVRQITCPILLLTGDPEAGAIITPEEAQEIAGLWHEGRVVHIEGTSHDIHYDQFDRYVEAVKAFLAEVDAREAGG